MNLSFGDATEADADSIALLRTDASALLTQAHGDGHWSGGVTGKGVLHGLRSSRVLVARRGAAIVATLRLATKKPWAIDVSYFTPVRKVLYLSDMAVAPSAQRQGIGRHLLHEATAVARAWPSDAIRLDAYDSDAGASAFYAKCGWREVGRVTYRGTALIYFELLL